MAFADMFSSTIFTFMLNDEKPLQVLQNLKLTLKIILEDSIKYYSMLYFSF